ncbi:hypothetical protein JYK13_19370 [Citrobacter sp. ku-bf4]|uniref:hypothetical protein n=1 Tax=Citrobacter TaxID=544 RepID=UPI0019802498|nr:MULTISPECIES: hypothetical protein [Citrobacter]MBN6046143.1 hypothetical protein [Citrobacter sp. ku-bf4]MBS0827659.1 hypothetical protein [Citrobacter amalonaticus]
MKKIFQFIYLFLLVISASSYLVGWISYLSIILLVIINLTIFKLDTIRYGIIVIFILFVVFNVISTMIKGLDIDLVVINFTLQLIFLVTLKFDSNIQRKLILRSLVWVVIISSILSVGGYVVGDYSTFVDAGHAKGFDGVLAMRGVFATPQLMASVCLAILFLSSRDEFKTRVQSFLIYVLAFVVLLFTVNRVNIAGFFVLGLICFNDSFRNNKLWVTLKLLSPLVIISIVVTILHFISLSDINLQTLESRALLVDGVLSKVDMNSLSSLLFGDFSAINFYIPQYQVDINYVENGFLFIIKYFGFLSLMIYIVVAAYCSLCMINKSLIKAVYIFYYFFIVQNFTNEFVSIVFPLVVFMLFSCFNRQSVNDTRHGHFS